MSSTSKHGLILDAVVTAIKSLDLAGIADGNVQRMQLGLVDRAFKLGTLKLPAVIVSVVQGSETITRATNRDDDVGYPCTVALVTEAEYVMSVANEEKTLLWREQAVEKFEAGRLAGMGNVWDVRVEPANIVSLNAWVGSSLFVSGFIVRAIQRNHVRGS